MTKTIRTIFLLAVIAVVSACESTSSFEQLIESNKEFDMAILNAKIIDGSGAPAYIGDMLISGDEIAFIGEVDIDQIKVDKTVDASDMVLSPGFIDAHAHANPLYDSTYTNFLASGVTTILIGQDGGQPGIRSDEIWTDIEAWMEMMSSVPLELNVASLAGHGTLRYRAQIPNEATASGEQIDQLRTELTRAMEAGCFGISTGLEYVPGMYADKKELSALAEVIGAHDALMMSHMRNEDDDAIEASLEELLSLGEYCKVHVSHIKVVYGKGKDRGNEIIQILDSAAQRGTRVSADVYPYIASYTGIGILFPSWSKTTRQFEEAKRTRKTELEEYLLNRVIKRNGPEATLFGSGEYAGKTLKQVADEEGRSYVDVLMDVGPQGASGAYFIMDEALQDVFITYPEIMIASDGSPTALHPRGHGTQARIIDKYVNQQNQLTIEGAIYKMSGLPAKTIGLTRRGTIQVGHKADLLIFDPAKVKEKATFPNPYQLSEGFDHIIINGQVVRDKGEFVKHDAGKLLKSN